MAATRTLKVKEIYKEWFKTVIKFILPSSSLKLSSVAYVNDVHRGISARNCSRDKRGQSETRVDMFVSEQKMLPYKVWLAISHNFKYKQHLVSLFATSLFADGSVQPSSYQC